MSSASPSLSNRYQSYQQGTAPASPAPGGGSGRYTPPTVYADQQTNVLTDTLKTHVEADQTAQNVLARMTSQRQQLKDANDNTWEMRQTTEQVKRELQSLKQKYREKKLKLYVMIGALGLTDLILFLRIIQCHGNFWC